MSNAFRLSVVVAVEHAQENLPAILEQLQPASHPDVEYLICHTATEPVIPDLVSTSDNFRILCGQCSSRIPHLWRDGILAAHGERVATTTAHCIPAADWVDRLLAVDLSGNTVAIGGIIESDADAGPADWAIFLLRYINYAPPQAARQVHEIAADNAVYRRTVLLEYRELLEHGFWEPSFHARFRQAGLRLQLDPELRVVHHNRYTVREFLSQRFAHGREFGLTRAARLSFTKRLALTVLAPLLPLRFLSKIVAATRQNPRYRARLSSSLPWLMLFLLGWGTGEARGYLKALYRRTELMESVGT